MLSFRNVNRIAGELKHVIYAKRIFIKTRKRNGLRCVRNIYLVFLARTEKKNLLLVLISKRDERALEKEKQMQNP